MRRRHNIIAATLLVFGITYLCARREGDLFDSSHEAEQGLKAVGASSGAEEIESGKLAIAAQLATTLLPHPTSVLVLDDINKLFADSTNQEIVPPPDEVLLPAVGELPHPIGELPPADGGLSPADGELPPVDGELPPAAGSQWLSSDTPKLSDDTTSDRSPSNVEYPFQSDLDLNIPASVLQELGIYAPHNYEPNGPRTFAYATFMATRNPSIKDPYFLAICSLVYRILWSPQTRTQKNHPFIVFVAHFVTQEQRALFAGAGAIVRELKPLEWHCEAEGVQRRWKDLFAKLNMWAETDFERILFLDADAFPLTNIDAMFDMAPVQDCVEGKLQLDDFLSDRTPVCEPYVFAGVPQEPTNLAHPNINVGSMVFTPSLRMHQRLIQNFLKTDHYDCAMAEQAFLNWQFSTEGAFPPTSLDRQWGGFFPMENEGGNLRVVHEKIWAAREGWTKKVWESGWEEMVKWYENSEFAKQRKNKKI